MNKHLPNTEKIVQAFAKKETNKSNEEKGKLVPNKIYYIYNEKNITLNQLLIIKAEGKTPHLMIDRFFYVTNENKNSDSINIGMKFQIKFLIYIQIQKSLNIINVRQIIAHMIVTIFIIYLLTKHYILSYTKNKRDHVNFVIL